LVEDTISCTTDCTSPEMVATPPTMAHTLVRNSLAVFRCSL